LVYFFIGWLESPVIIEGALDIIKD